MNGHKEDSGNAFFLLLCLMIGVLFLLPTWYANRAGSINGALLDLAKAQLTVFSAFSNEAYEAWERITRADPAALGWDQVMAVLRYSGKWIRWPYALALAALGVAAIWTERADSSAV